MVRPSDTTRFNNSLSSGESLPLSILNFADVISQNVFLHPFVALKRSCQVNRKCSSWVSVQPVSLVPFMYHQAKMQGFTALYKGLSSELLVSGLVLGSETIIARFSDWPTEIGNKRPIEDGFKILAMKALSVTITTPFFCSSLFETVQSAIVVNDRPAFMDCLKEGLHRLFNLGFAPSNRMLPIWILVPPTVVYHISHYILKNVTRLFIDLYNRRSHKRIHTDESDIQENRNQQTWQNSKIEVTKTRNKSTVDVSINATRFESTITISDSLEQNYERISSNLLASFFAECLLLPVETVLNSLYLQGTRVIIDNCDETTVVLPVITNYEGFFDCYQSIVRFEGNLGPFKGLGAIFLKYAAYYTIMRSVHHLLKETLCEVNIDDYAMNTTKKLDWSEAHRGPRIDNLAKMNRQSTPLSQYQTVNELRLNNSDNSTWNPNI